MENNNGGIKVGQYQIKNQYEDMYNQIKQSNEERFKKNNNKYDDILQ